MIGRKLAKIVMNEAKNKGDALASASRVLGINEMHDDFGCLQSINEILNILLKKHVGKHNFGRLLLA